MARQLQSDKVLFGVVVGLVLFGALMVFSASAVMAQEKFGSSYYFLFRQLAWAAAGTVAMVVMMNVDYRRLASSHVVFPALALQTVLLLAVLFADRAHKTHRWFHLGPGSFQPRNSPSLSWSSSSLTSWICAGAKSMTGSTLCFPSP